MTSYDIYPAFHFVYNTQCMLYNTPQLSGCWHGKSSCLWRVAESIQTITEVCLRAALPRPNTGSGPQPLGTLGLLQFVQTLQRQLCWLDSESVTVTGRQGSDSTASWRARDSHWQADSDHRRQTRRPGSWLCCCPAAWERTPNFTGELCPGVRVENM